MASRGSSLSAFQHVNPSRCVSNSSFSIRSILDLPEETVEKCHGSLLRNDSPVASYSVSLPLVPRVVRPMVHHYADSVQCSSLRNWQDIGLAPYGHHWGQGALSFREQAFPIGEWINSIQNSGICFKWPCISCLLLKLTTMRTTFTVVVICNHYMTFGLISDLLKWKWRKWNFKPVTLDAEIRENEDWTAFHYFYSRILSFSKHFLFIVQHKRFSV